MKTIRQIIIIGTVLFLFANFATQAQTNIIIQPPEIALDHTVKIKWNSETGAVFQVESADALGVEGAQGLQWVIRESECTSKGTYAEWMDVGDTRWIPRIFHPILQPQRFYRVQKIGQATNTPPVVAIQLSQTNSISGDLNISVSVSLVDTNQELSTVGVFVDGQRLFRKPATNFVVSINSTEWPNGTHEIYAIATTLDAGDFGETTLDDSQTVTNEANLAIGVSASQFGVFSNYISQFFVAVPFFQAGQTQEIVAKFEEDSYWRVTVVNYLDTEVRQFEGQGSSAYAAWDGNDDFGSPLSYGYYDYIVKARPSSFGPLGSMSSMASSFVGTTSVSPPIDRAADYKRTPEAMQFSRTNCDVTEVLVIPSLNYTNNTTGTNSGGGGPPSPNSFSFAPSQENLYPSSPQEALANGLTYYFSPAPPMPPVYTNRQWFEWNDVFGVAPPSEIQIPTSVQDEFLRDLSTGKSFSSQTSIENQTELTSWNDAVYTTRTPTRIPGNLFFGFAGTVGVGYQGHHPSKPPSFAKPNGGVLAGTPPWGKLKTAASLANNFSSDMSSAGWRTSFLLGDDNFNSTNLNPVLGPYSGTTRFASSCNFGLLVGHMSASSHTDNDYGATVPYFPVYNSAQPGAYQWIALPNMDFGNTSGTSKLRWMAMYGCQSLKERDYDDMWTKFLIPMPPNLRLILGSEDGVFIMPSFGSRLAANLNGWTTPSSGPMTIFDAWCDAAANTDEIMSHHGIYRLPFVGLGTRRMSVIYRDTTQDGSWDTLSDSIWNWGTDVSYDWFDVSFFEIQVYPR